MELGLRGKNALVTGGSRGIGKAIALALAQEGVNVAICARTREPLEQTEQEIKSFGVDCLAIQSDLEHSSGVDGMFIAYAQWKPRLDILVNNVGGGGRWGNINPEKTSERTWQEVYTKNASVAIGCTMHSIKLMQQRDIVSGRIVTIASIYGKEAGGRPWFVMAKAAQIAMMKSFAIDPRFGGITFNTVCPGHIKVNKAGEEDWPGPWGQPEDVAGLVAFLCSEQAHYINGACIVVDGGESRSF